MQVLKYSCPNLGLPSKSFSTHMRRTLNILLIILMTTSKTLTTLLMAPRRGIRGPLTLISKPGSNRQKNLRRTRRQPSDRIAPSVGTPKRRRRSRSSLNSHSAAERASLAHAASLPRNPPRPVNLSARRVSTNRRKSPTHIIRSPHGPSTLSSLS
jgi:hypothetical protein